ncbi:DNA internalization-related competence protein ComEC/Rec2 [Pseudoalteromonas piscicida]|uniref:DNA internalization-related competence protein ComEC/Rec2 n=1 Tax=Pseudoalteromonas piscicida TaxID=43662 RepID=UPI003221D5A8
MLICFGIVIGCFTAVFLLDNWRIAAISLFLYFIGRYSKPFYRILAGFILGIFIVLVHYLVFHQLNIQQQWLDGPISISGLVTEVKQTPAGESLVIEIQQFENKALPSWKTVKAKLYRNSALPVLVVGNTVEMRASLKRYRSRINIGLFNAELHAFRKQVYFKGNVKKIDAVHHHFNWRLNYRVKLANMLDGLEYNWLYYILLSGDTSKSNYAHTQQFRELGLSHLLAISGLHIGIVFTIAFWLIKAILYCWPMALPQSINLHQICLLSALLFCASYVFLCGYSVSATRALLMATTWVGCYCLGLRLKSSEVLTLALVGVLILDPFALLNPGLYYSFFAVAIIVALIQKARSGWFAKFVVLAKLQLALFVLLMPLNLYFFAGISVISLIANLVIIPLVSFVVFPALIVHIGLLSRLGWEQPLALIDDLLAYIIHLLTSLPIGWLAAPSSSSQLLLCIYWCVVLLWILRSYLGLLPLLIYFVDIELKPSPNWQLDVFDVGHGTAVLISKNHDGLLYDLGANYFGYFSIFDFVVKPYLLNNKIALKTTVISHNDGDHNGGLGALYKYDGGRSLQQFHGAGEPLGCKLGAQTFQGLKVHALWPKAISSNDNNNSCVISVSDGQFTVLLPGDIEATVEKQLVAEHKTALKADVLLVPHHGSSSSSSDEFIKTVAPKIAIFSRAYYSPWKIPSNKVIARYKKAGVKRLDTALDGHIKILFFEHKIAIERGRVLENYWFLR